MNSEFKDIYHGGFTHTRRNISKAILDSDEKYVYADTDNCIYERVMPTATFELSDAEKKYTASDTAAVRDKVLECWIRHLAKKMGREVTDEYVQHCIDSWRETMKLLG